MQLSLATLVAGAVALLALSACTINEPSPPPMAAQPAPVVVTPAPQPAPGTVVVQPPPRAY
jgi:hypothetical protein